MRTQFSELMIVAFILSGLAISALFPRPFFAQVSIPKVQHLPQVAVGGTSGGLNMSTTVFLVNNSSSMVSGIGELFKDDGSALQALIRGSGEASRFEWSLGPGQALRVVLASKSSSIDVGWLKITSQGETGVAVAALFQLFNGTTLVSEAGVLPSPAQTASTIFYDSLGPNTDTGVAFANSNNQANDLTLRLLSLEGRQLGETRVSIPPNGHLARFISQAFPNVPGITEMEASVAVIGSIPFSTLTLRSDGLLFTTLPVIEGAFPGIDQIISYTRDLSPLFVRYDCVGCHSPSMPINRFDISSYEGLMRGDSVNGPLVIGGDGAGSPLVQILEGTFRRVNRMPPRGPYMRAEEVKAIRDWIDQGATNN